MIAIIESLDRHRCFPFLNRIKDAPFVGDISFEILSDAGEVVAAAGSGNLAQQAAAEAAANQSEGVIHRRVDGRESIITYLRSPFNEWKYVYATPRQVYLRSMRAISYTQNAVLLIAVLIGLGLIAMLVRRQYAPIQRFLDMLPDSREDGQESEYKQIEHIIQQSLQVRKKAMDALSEQKKMLQDTFLLKLMRGETRDSAGRDVLEREHEFIQPLCLWGGGGFFIPENRGYYASGAWV